MKVADGELPILARWIQEATGVVIESGKAYLVESRLGAIAERAGCSSFADLHFRLKHGNDQKLVQDVVDAITTHETLFFRDRSPFDALQHKALPELIDEKFRLGGKPRLRIWSAACSTGQEPYSIAIVLSELLGKDIDKLDVRIDASDISGMSIAQASLGVYSEIEITRCARPELVDKYFTRARDGWRVQDRLRGLISFQRRNLLQPFGGIGPYDVVFCRNVSIYFDRPTRADLFQRLLSVMTETGYLFVGASEILSDLGPQFVPLDHCRATFYRPKLRAALAPRR